MITRKKLNELNCRDIEQKKILNESTLNNFKLIIDKYKTIEINN
jgi:hypothetical protein